MDLVSLLLMVAPFCSGSSNEWRCTQWVAQCVKQEQELYPNQTLDNATEVCSENIPNEYWE